MWMGIRSITYLSLRYKGRVYANNHCQIPVIVNEPAQPQQPISIVIRSQMVTFDRLLVGEGGFDLDFRIIRNRFAMVLYLYKEMYKYGEYESCIL